MARRRTARGPRLHRRAPPGPGAHADEITVQLGLRRPPSWDVTGYTADAAPDRIACVWVRVGPLTVRALDAQAVRSVADAWAYAHDLAVVLFRPGRVRRHTR